MKTVSQLDDAGYLIGEVDADESPLEPGVYLIPGGAVDATAPNIPEGQRAKWDNGWVMEPIQLPEPEPEPAPPTPEQMVVSIAAAVQAHMDDAAKAAGYGDIKSAVTYADEPAVSKFQQEGQAFRAWRSLVWAKCYALLDAMQDGSRPLMTAEEVISELPALARVE